MLSKHTLLISGERRIVTSRTSLVKGEVGAVITPDQLQHCACCALPSLHRICTRASNMLVAGVRSLALIAMTVGLVSACEDSTADNYRVEGQRCYYPPVLVCDDQAAANFQPIASECAQFPATASLVFYSPRCHPVILRACACIWEVIFCSSAHLCKVLQPPRALSLLRPLLLLDSLPSSLPDRSLPRYDSSHISRRAVPRTSSHHGARGDSLSLLPSCFPSNSFLTPSWRRFCYLTSQSYASMMRHGGTHCMISPCTISSITVASSSTTRTSCE